jgi:hypothetical protein
MPGMSSTSSQAPRVPPSPDDSLSQTLHLSGGTPLRASLNIQRDSSSPGPSGSQQQLGGEEGHLLGSAQGSYAAAGLGTGVGSTPSASRAASIAPASSAHSMQRRPSSAHSHPLLVLPGMESAPQQQQQLSSRALRQLARQQQEEGLMTGMRLTLQRWDPAARARSGARTRRNSSSSNTSAVPSTRLLGLNLRTASQVSMRSSVRVTSAAATSSEMRPGTGTGTGGPGTGSEVLLQESIPSNAQVAGFALRQRPGSSSEATQQESVQGTHSATGEWQGQ